LNEKILQVKNLKTYFPVRGGFFNRVVNHVKAVDGVSFDVLQGETFGLVGESGCGKSTTGRTIMKLLEATDGEINFQGKNLKKLNNREMFNFRKDIQMIFQDPYSSLNPRKTVKQIVGQAFDIHQPNMDKKEKDNKIKELLLTVGLDPDYAIRYPHEFSGGQRQRIGIARALALNPKLIIADEPVSALDVSIQSQVLNLLNDLQKKFNLTYIFIAHNLSVVKYLSDRVGVMYLGKIVEISKSEELYKNPMHPYTQALLSAIPEPVVGVKKERVILQGDVPSPLNPPSGCRFHTRCPLAEGECLTKEPELMDMGNGHKVACHKVSV
jgi:oligopeptide/dipeptide ABC transporter ATP-binding protein